MAVACSGVGVQVRLSYGLIDWTVRAKECIDSNWVHNFSWDRAFEIAVYVRPCILSGFGVGASIQCVDGTYFHFLSAFTQVFTTSALNFEAHHITFVTPQSAFGRYYYKINAEPSKFQPLLHISTNRLWPWDASYSYRQRDLGIQGQTTICNDRTSGHIGCPADLSYESNHEIISWFDS